MRIPMNYLVAVILLCSHTGRAQQPILLLSQKGSFSAYTAEILKLEGFNEFDIRPLERISTVNIKSYDVVVLPHAMITDAEAKVLSAYVRSGGNLVALRPDKKLAVVFGLQPTADSLTDGYIEHPSGETLQFHGTADQYKIAGSRIIAKLYKNATDSTEFPAVTFHKYGSGHAMAFTYNLPQSISLTRQGNYLDAGQEKDGIKGIRAMDLFTGGWVDTSKNRLNQADEQMRMLTHGIEQMNSYKKPLPRFWYFPDSLKCLVTLTNDGEYSDEKDIDPQLADVESKGANMSLYILTADKISKASTDAWQKRGNEISGHPDDTKNAEHPTWQNMSEAISTKIKELNTRYGINSMRTIVNHWFVWCGTNEQGDYDFTAQARIEKENGIEMDINYAHYDNNSSQGHFLGAMGYDQGNYTGTGMPLKFTDKEGEVIDIYQHINDVYDQQYMEHADTTGFFNCFKGLMDRSLHNEVYTFISAKAHNDEYRFSKKPLMQMLDYARANEVPVWTPVKLLDFLKAKDEATFTGIKWSADGRLSFRINSSLQHPNALTCMLPYVHKGKKVGKVICNTSAKNYSKRKINGFEYVLFTVNPGSVYNVEVHYTN